MAILITGAGLVGAQIANILVEQGENPILFDFRPDKEAIKEVVDLEKCKIITGDLLNKYDLMNAVVNNGVTKIIHTVAYPGLTAGCIREPYKSIELNIMGTVNVLEIARLLKLEKVVACSTCGIHSAFFGGEESDDMTREEHVKRTGSIYTTTKMCVENLVYNYASDFGVDACVVRLTGVYGPWKHSGGVLSLLIMNALKAAVKGEEVTLYDIPFDLIYAKDAARGCVAALEGKVEKDRVFNICTGTVYSVEELSQAIQNLIPGIKVNVVPFMVEGKVMQAPKVITNATRTKEQLGFTSKYSLEEGVKEMLDWIKAQ